MDELELGSGLCRPGLAKARAIKKTQAVHFIADADMTPMRLVCMRTSRARTCIPPTSSNLERRLIARPAASVVAFDGGLAYIATVPSDLDTPSPEGSFVMAAISRALRVH